MGNQADNSSFRYHLRIASVERGMSGIGTWVSGTVNGHGFQAKMFRYHASNQDWEICRSRIAKLEVWRLQDGHVAFSWDRGAQQLPKDPLGREQTTMAIVDFITTGALDGFGRDPARDRRELLRSQNRVQAIKRDVGLEH